MSNTLKIFQENGTLKTTSLALSHNFGKKHQHIMEAIRGLDCSKEFNESNFRPISYTDGSNRQKPAYNITRDGFIFLCMGFTGQAAAQWKERYIQAFNDMEHQLNAQRNLQMVAQTAQNQRLIELFLNTNPLYEKIVRYSQLGLRASEIAKLCDMSIEALRPHRIKLAELNMIDPPAKGQTIKFKFTDQQLTDMYHDHQNGHTLAELGRQYNCCGDTIKRHLKAKEAREMFAGEVAKHG